MDKILKSWIWLQFGKLLFEEKLESGKEVLEGIKSQSLDFVFSLENSYLRRKQNWRGKSLNG